MEQLERSVAELQRSRRRIVAAQEECKKAVAEELHGPVQTQMLMLSLKLGEVRDLIDTSPKEAQEELAGAAADLDGNPVREINGLLAAGRLPHNHDIRVGREQCDQHLPEEALVFDDQDFDDGQPRPRWWFHNKLKPMMGDSNHYMPIDSPSVCAPRTPGTFANGRRNGGVLWRMFGGLQP